jgi:carbon-monoxide dehydrogenase small subunit
VNERIVSVELNGQPFQWRAMPNELLLTRLREAEFLTGTKYGCGIGECGACTVHIDGRPTLSCLVLTQTVEGRKVTTIEGLAKKGELDPLQASFLEHAALQCGFCTPGMIMTAQALLDANPRPTEEDVRRYLRGVLCRCTGYASIVRAVMNAHSHA